MLEPNITEQMTLPGFCGHCGSIISGRRRSHAVWCSQECRIAGQRKRRVQRSREGRFCEWCEESIPLDRRLNAKFCCDECLQQSHNGPKKTKEKYDKRIASKYNLSIEKYLEILNNGCIICVDDFDIDKKLHIDHNHNCCPGDTSCGKCVRGALCNRHNVGIGMFRDKIEELEKAIIYLREM